MNKSWAKINIKKEYSRFAKNVPEKFVSMLADVLCADITSAKGWNERVKSIELQACDMSGILKARVTFYDMKTEENRIWRYEFRPADDFPGFLKLFE